MTLGRRASASGEFGGTLSGRFRSHSGDARRRAIGAVGMLLALGTPLESQDRVGRSATLIVEVRDTTGRPVPAVRVSLAATNRVTFTDSAGVAQLRGLPSAVWILEVMRVGFLPESASIATTEGISDTVEVELRPIAVVLEAVSVFATTDGFDPDLTAMYERWRSGIFRRSSFVTREDLERGQFLRVSDALRGVPGIRLRTGRDGSARATTVRSQGVGLLRSCASMVVYLDGVRLYPEVDGVRIDRIPIAELAGIEAYQSGASAPAQYGGTGADCGVLLLWTKRR